MKKSIICNNKIDTEYFNTRILGGVLVSADIFTSPCVAESAVEVTISDCHLCKKISQYAFLHGEDLQSLFKDNEYTYMSCFIRDTKAFQLEFKNEVALKKLFHHDKGSTDYYLISFPEMSIQPQKIMKDYSYMMLQSEILFRHLNTDNLSKIVLEILDCNILITGGGEKKFLLEKNNISNSKYFDFTKLSENIDREELLPYLVDDIVDCPERTVILNAVDLKIGIKSKVYKFLLEMRQRDKRMIVVMHHDNINFIKSLFDVVITLSVDKFGFERVKDVELIP